MSSGEQFLQFGKAPEGGKVSDGPEKREGLLVDFSQLLQFNEINSSLTGFKFRDKGLRFRQLTGDLNLSEAGVFSGLDQAMEKCSVLLDVFATLQNLTSRLA